MAWSSKFNTSWTVDQLISMFENPFLTCFDMFPYSCKCRNIFIYDIRHISYHIYIIYIYILYYNILYYIYFCLSPINTTSWSKGMIRFRNGYFIQRLEGLLKIVSLTCRLKIDGWKMTLPSLPHTIHETGIFIYIHLPRKLSKCR